MTCIWAESIVEKLFKGEGLFLAKHIDRYWWWHSTIHSYFAASFHQNMGNDLVSFIEKNLLNSSRRTSALFACQFLKEPEKEKLMKALEDTTSEEVYNLSQTLMHMDGSLKESCTNGFCHNCSRYQYLHLRGIDPMNVLVRMSLDHQLRLIFSSVFAHA